MLLAASPHSNENQSPDVYDALSTTSPKALASPVPADAKSNGEDVISSPPSAARAPTHALHTPQQLAQLEAITRAQSREKPESTLVSDDEKYLAAQVCTRKIDTYVDMAYIYGGLACLSSVSAPWVGI